MEKFIKQNWLKITIAVAVILVSFSIFYYFVLFTSHKEQTRLNQETQKQLLQEQEKQEKEVQIQKETQLAVEIKYWDDLKQQIQESRGAASKIRSSAEVLITQKRSWLNNAYLQKSNSYYYRLIPMINASEHYIITLQNLIDSVDKVNSIRYEMLSAIEGWDQVAIDNLMVKESLAVDTMSYWINQEQKEARDANTLQTESIKNY